ncbi:MAG: hypothetical protein EOO43_13105 [Flavobacterium sp.]|nr:MAG: hypothetical protein EOO43_13105 [Flavobacterium sp.]
MIDYTSAVIVAVGLFALSENYKFPLPAVDQSLSVLSDLTTISLTLVGFILTLLTVLITFKSGSKVHEVKVDSEGSIFDLFFATGLYFETVRHLKNCIKSLIFVGFIGFTIKLGLSAFFKANIFYFNTFSIIIVLLTTYRCLLILGAVLNLQHKSFNKFEP